MMTLECWGACDRSPFDSDDRLLLQRNECAQTSGHLRPIQGEHHPAGGRDAVDGRQCQCDHRTVGNGVLCLESPSPKEELIEVTLQDDVLKVDGNMAIAWSGMLLPVLWAPSIWDGFLLIRFACVRDGTIR